MAGTPDERLAFVQCLISVAAMDHKVSDLDNDIIRRYVKEFELPALGRPEYKVYDIHKIPGRIKTPILKAAVVREMQNVAQKDGTFKGEERGLIEYLRHAWGLPTPAGVPDGVPGTPAQLKALESRYQMKLDRVTKALDEAERALKAQQIATMRAQRAARGPSPLLIIVFLIVAAGGAFFVSRIGREERGSSGAIRGAGIHDTRKPAMEEYLLSVDKVFADAVAKRPPIDDCLKQLEAITFARADLDKPVPKDIYADMYQEQVRVPTLRQEVDALRAQFRDLRVDVPAATKYLNEIWTLGPLLDHRVRATRIKASHDPALMIDLGVPVNRTERGRALLAYIEETFPKTAREVRDRLDDITTYILDWQAIYLTNRAYAIDHYNFPTLEASQFVPVVRQSPYAYGGTVISSVRLVNKSGILVTNPHGTVTFTMKDGKTLSERFAVMWITDEESCLIDGLSIPPDQVRTVSLNIWTDARKCEKDFDASTLEVEH